ncbi:hypothetical protein CALVIDRAFT_126822 [Calocera viscosa TUFC12733]|uniref:Peptide N-acetyl-beta-D-glucosaminyl asparaginase amidase A N-terminal domain-containing protein n=1 Tax=Calocera viscosa (strain TUFC12733) TaxID=1330018 RepID=A0A167RRB7_CALVF|nr:hypothetical protein CALVIDRAFT_126822 [Calocera viscosa TUFC12733]
MSRRITMARLSFGSVLLSCLYGALSVVAQTAPLVDFQVQQPPAAPPSQACEYVLMTHSFANSYGQPGVAAYTPPTDCGPIGEWAAISLNFTCTSQGVQYDRLAILSLSSTEIWRSSTAEPTSYGIIFTALKDVTRYSALFSAPGELVFDIGNLLSEDLGLTGVYNATLTATFYAPASGWPQTQKADQIIPLGNPGATSDPMFSVPPGGNTTVTLPRNVAQAYVEIFASGNSAEEFWYTNVADEYYNSLPPDTTYEDGPFREVRLLIDGVVAGAAFPYPVVFTGGILPTLWRPISAYGSFDQPTYYIDITPFLGTLSDGNEHIFTLDVASAETDHAINGNWYLSGNIQLQLASTSIPTTGKILNYNVSPYALPSVSGVVSPNGDVNVTVKASRYVDITAEIITNGYEANVVTWTQSLEYTNFQAYLDDTTVELVDQTSSGTSRSTHNGLQVVYDEFNYPFYMDYYLVTIGNDSGWYASIDHSYDRTFLPSPLIPQSTIATHQYGAGVYLYDSSGYFTFANGSTTETFSYYSSTGDTYTRDVTAVNSNITSDQIGGSLANPGTWWAGWGVFGAPAGTNGAGSSYVTRTFGPVKLGVRINP